MAYISKTRTFTTTKECKKQGKMSANEEWVSWYEKPQTQQSTDTGEQKSSLGTDEKDAPITDPGNVDVQSGVFNKVANTFTQLFSNKQCHLTRNQTRTKIGWTTTGELGVLRQEQDAQYEFMEELEQKIKDLNKEVGVLKDLVKAYEAKMERDNDLLQHCMHWITMVQVFGDVPVARDRMRWKPGRDAALVGGSEDGSEDGNENEDEGDKETTI
ncbi:hypothetical protein TGAM01_v202646 [Trichoderma gamsii]|uniref:Uncharacterized protein n=1 Tax=Trichoderma gamsii TaxID=398673 RepID=A0A2P4ZV36_9HYPO|nr:hypothetical protein TGAM01_v202646 [Trichoderma gamsii]PON28152.1 hypothetical protein TGAM01_v202646 [Trichoderma gamsii]